MSGLSYAILARAASRMSFFKSEETAPLSMRASWNRGRMNSLGTSFQTSARIPAGIRLRWRLKPPARMEYESTRIWMCSPAGKGLKIHRLMPVSYGWSTPIGLWLIRSETKCGQRPGGIPSLIRWCLKFANICAVLWRSCVRMILTGFISIISVIPTTIIWLPGSIILMLRMKNCIAMPTSPMTPPRSRLFITNTDGMWQKVRLKNSVAIQ